MVSTCTGKAYVFPKRDVVDNLTAFRWAGGFEHAALDMGLPADVEVDGKFAPGLHAEVALKVFTGLDAVAESGLSSDAYCTSP